MIVRTTGIAITTAPPTPGGPASPTPRKPRPPADSHGDRAGAAAQAIAGKRCAGHDTSAATRAAQKMNALAGLLATSANLESALAKLLQTQSKQKRSTVRSGERSIKNNYLKMKRLTEKKLEAIEKRREAEGRRGFWGKLLNVFDAVLKCGAATVAGCAGGTVGIIGATLLISSVVVSNTVRSRTGGWVAAGLGAGGGLCMSEASSVLMGHAMKYVQRANAYAGSLVAAPRGDADKDALQARACISRLATDKARAEYAVEEARQQIQQAIEAMARSGHLVLSVVDSRNRSTAGTAA